MDNLDLISDQELRHRLMQYGFPNLPVTATSRKVLIKKLRNYMTSEKQKLRRETTNATKYSSDEEASDRETNSRKHRSTIGSVITSSSSAAPSSSSNGKYNSMPPPIMAPKRSVATLARPSVTSKSEFKSTSPSSVYISPVLRSSSDTEEESDYGSENLSNESGAFTTTAYGQRYNSRPSSSSFVGRSPLSTIRQQQHSFNSETSYMGNDSNLRTSFNGSTSSMPTEFSLSDRKRRMLSIGGRDSSINPIRSSSLLGTSQHRSTLYNNKETGHVYQANAIPAADRSNHFGLRKSFTKFLQMLNEQYRVQQNFVPCLLLSCLVIFFASVAFMYLAISPNLANIIGSNNAEYSICMAERDFSDAHGFSCVDKLRLDAAMELIKLTTAELQKRAERHKCIDVTMPYSMSAEEVINMALHNNPNAHVLSVLKDLHAMEYLIQMNPQWQIRNVDAVGRMLTLGEVSDLRSRQENHFAILNPRLPLLCSISNKLKTFFYVIGGLSIAFITTYGIYYFYRTARHVYLARQLRVKRLIADIISELIDKSICDASTGGGGAVVINHLREKLIDPTERHRFASAWDSAISFLEQNDSRIQFEVGTRNGEECKMMRWIDSVAPSSTSLSSSSSPAPVNGNQSSSVKRWQSSAFDKTNKVKDPPTQCLKIRQMFNSYEANNPNLKQIIQDAILEKVGTDCKIYDIELDQGSCCVYVRCATPTDAGLVHDRINGWWFDSSLVSIKFLRLDRYLTRFPRSLGGPACLRPSNANNSSMSDCRSNGGGGAGDGDRNDGGPIGEDD